MNRKQQGFSLVELLVVIAIIGVLLAVQLPTLSRAIRYARQVEARETVRQEGIGRMADNANAARPQRRTEISRDEARAAFRRKLPLSQNGEILITEMLCEVHDVFEFRAYWYTLIDPDATDPLQFDRGELVATDPDTGKVHRLPIADESFLPNKNYPVMWEFLTTRAASGTAAGNGIIVEYSAGNTAYIKYPGAFPAIPVVAELSQRYVDKLGL